MILFGSLNHTSKYETKVRQGYFSQKIFNGDLVSGILQIKCKHFIDQSLKCNKKLVRTSLCTLVKWWTLVQQTLLGHFFYTVKTLFFKYVRKKCLNISKISYFFFCKIEWKEKIKSINKDKFTIFNFVDFSTFVPLFLFKLPNNPSLRLSNFKAVF